MNASSDKPIRVLVVEDSTTIRRYLCDVLGSDRRFEVVGEAGDGERAIDLCRTRRPDVITMDMMLPVMTGLQATEEIMAHFATPILIVSSSTNRGEAFHTYDALAAGAVDVLDKPSGEEPDGEWEAKLCATLLIVSRIRVITHLRGRLRGRSQTPIFGTPAVTSELRQIDVVAIGASTGGPGAVVDVLRALPKRFDLPILLVLHISEKFGFALAEWLDQQVGRPVAYAVDGEAIHEAAGRVLLAPPTTHFAVHNRRVRLTRDPERHSCRPSVDVLFETAAVEYGRSLAACILTGMGRDGAEGLLRVRRAGGMTFGQDEATSIIYGMPREAALIGAVEQVLPLDRIGPALAALPTKDKSR